MLHPCSWECREQSSALLVAQCEPFLHEQLALLQPKLIVLLGRFAAQSLLGTEASIASLRGRLHTVKSSGRSVPAVVTYHPAYLLRNPADKAKAWVDLCMARRHESSQIDSGYSQAD